MAREPHRNSDILDAVALLVIDMQAPFLDTIATAPAIIERCGFAIEAARAFGIKVLFTEQVPEKLGRTDPRLTALAGGNSRVFSKSSFSALQAEGLQDHLRRLGVYHLLLAGIETPICVYQTALHASDSDFDVTVLADCVAGRRAEDARVVLGALNQANCHILPAETVFYSMLGHAGHPRFGAYTKLVKRYNSPDPLGQPREDEPEAAPSVAPQPQPEAEHRDEPFGAPANRERDREESRPSRRSGRRRGDRPSDRPKQGESSKEETPPPEPDTPDTVADERPAARREDTDLREPYEPHEDDDAPDALPADEADESPGEDGESRKRPRRRRGGARRRRARERAAAPGGETPAGEPAANDAEAAHQAEAPASPPVPEAPSA